MKVDDIRTILRALNDADVRYLIVGGLAVVAHGYVRFTQDIDLVIQLEREKRAACDECAHGDRLPSFNPGRCRTVCR